MQLNKLPSQAKVLTLATGLMVSTPVFAYSDLDNLGNILTTRKNVDYMRTISSVEEFDIAQKFKFQMHLNAWSRKRCSLHLSQQLSMTRISRQLLEWGLLLCLSSRKRLSGNHQFLYGH